MADDDVPPTEAQIDAFIQTVIDNGFRDPRGTPKGGDAVYLASILLTALYPNRFVECRLSRWEWMAGQFNLPTAMEGASYASRIVTAATAAKQLIDTPTFQKYFVSEHPLWTVGGIQFLVNRNAELKALVEGQSSTITKIDTAILEAFGHFRESAAAQFMVRLRRHRVKELQTLLESPESIDLDTFNREVWVLWSSAKLKGENVIRLVAQDVEPSQEELQGLEAGLLSGDLEVHGNSVWGSATSIYGPMVPGGDDDRLNYVRRALEILTDENLEPLSQAKQILEIPGFGNNSATGLVMVFHPESFAIWNNPSSSAISKLGYHAADLDSFQRVVADLRQRLGAHDFLELDYFLYLLDQGSLGFSAKEPAWWVCQGTMYSEERKGGYVFAPKETMDGKVVQHHANVALMKPGQTVLHYANGAIQAVGLVLSAATERTRPDTMPGEEPNRLGNYVRVQYRELSPPIGLEEMPESWRTDGEQPFTRKGKVKQGYLFPVSQVFLTKLKEKFADRFPKQPDAAVRRVVKIAPGAGAQFWNECLNSGVIRVGWGEVGDLRRFKTKEEFRRQFAESFHDMYNDHGPTISRKANEVWTLVELTPGDLVVANQGISHVLAVGELLDPAYDYQFDPGRDAYSHILHVRWDTSVAKDIPKQGFWAMTTVCDVPADLYEFIVSRDDVPPEIIVPLKEYAEPPFEQIRDQIAGCGLRISDRTLRRYHISLKTRGFVILCGLSGSGKTWLAELYAKAVGAEKEVVPVAPNWTTNEDLIGYLNPMDGHYHDTRFSVFLRRAAEHYHEAEAARVTPRPYHLILDEMNLARVEYYFAKFLSAMEQRSRSMDARIELGGNELVSLPPNLFFIGTVNVDETTHGFADKVYDRAQLLELNVDRDALQTHLGNVPYAEVLMEIWDTIGHVTPFAFRVLDELKSYVAEASKVGVNWKEALDEQLLQKVLTKMKGADQPVEKALEQFMERSADMFPLSHAKAQRMLEMFRHHGITSYF
jgi:hypothetical protein